ncbi:hypothetical protein J2W56_006301 [Nocardia kruczakiae]|uniref:Restriction endonuclease n=1 Tax=Nocardia kruczakiae TaxID=261477 RepID=A0ABU1XPP3_9NOCA|nr:hypothetical protein [Nocardia kruczakiae]MDR7172536.1 hypothetical protein [Nocardia kruczakiae]
MESVSSGLQQARIAAQDHMRERINQGHMWDERTVTDLFLSAAYLHGEIRYAQFTQRQEAELGADWIWWFIDRSGECFGMLTQAKSLKPSTAGKYRIDFGYLKSRQIKRLRETADHLSIPAAYVLYCGDADYRRDLLCGKDCDRPLLCDECDRKAVSVLPALMAHHILGWESQRDAQLAFDLANPLERIDHSALEADWRYRPWRAITDPRLQAFLHEPQVGARRIAKSILSQVHAMRMGQASAMSTDTVDADSDAVFADLPDDRGHFPVAYFPYVLRGLRPRVPDYVVEFNESGEVSPDLAAIADGIVTIPV